MHVISKRKLQEFWLHYPDSEAALKAWYREAEHASWKSFSEIRQRYASADVIRGDRVVFNIKGNHYRLVVKLNYPTSTIFIRFIGTHEQYDQIDVERI